MGPLSGVVVGAVTIGETIADPPLPRQPTSAAAVAQSNVSSAAKGFSKKITIPI